MSSVAAGGPGTPPDPDEPHRTAPHAHGRDDRTARARIRDAAIERVARDGVAATTIRAIANDAGVSAGLVIHHFGSREGLLEACDRYVADAISAGKRAVMGAGPAVDPLAALGTIDEGLPLVRYLARTLAEGSPHVADLLDELVADAADYMQQGVASGALVPSAHPYERAAVLTLWVLGALTLHDHVERLLGVDLTRSPIGQPGGSAYLGAVLEMFGQGLFTDEMAATFRTALVAEDPRVDEDEGAADG